MRSRYGGKVNKKCDVVVMARVENGKSCTSSLRDRHPLEQPQGQAPSDSCRAGGAGRSSSLFLYSLHLFLPPSNSQHPWALISCPRTHPPGELSLQGGCVHEGEWMLGQMSRHSAAGSGQGAPTGEGQRKMCGWEVHRLGSTNSIHHQATVKNSASGVCRIEDHWLFWDCL